MISDSYGIHITFHDFVRVPDLVLGLDCCWWETMCGPGGLHFLLVSRLSLRLTALRNAPKKNASLIGDFSIRGGGGSEPIQKLWGTFFLNFWWNMTQKSAPKFSKKIAYGKVPRKFQKSGGGVRPFWKKSIIKLHFFFEKLPNWTHTTY